MKKFELVLSALLVAGAAFAATQATATKPKTQATKSSHAMTAAKTRTIEAEVVSADAAGKTLTVKEAGENKTLAVEGTAAKHLTSLKSGEKVKLTVRESAEGQPEAVTKIQAEKSSSSSTAKTPKK
jgi:hypothetical protein